MAATPSTGADEHSLCAYSLSYYRNLSSTLAALRAQEQRLGASERRNIFHLTLIRRFTHAQHVDAMFGICNHPAPSDTGRAGLRYRPRAQRKGHGLKRGPCAPREGRTRAYH